MTRTEEQTRNAHVNHIADAMMAAARTAPKARGTDNLEIMTICGEELQKLSEYMTGFGERSGQAFFVRDAGNILASESVVLIGTRIDAIGLNCGFCGFPTCAAKLEFPPVPCAFNTNDLGLAVGSAVSIAADNRVDNRVMYSAGRAAIEIGILKDSSVALAIALSCTGKSIYFDRQPKH